MKKLNTLPDAGSFNDDLWRIIMGQSAIGCSGLSSWYMESRVQETPLSI